MIAFAMGLESDGERLPIIQYWHSREIPKEISSLIETIRACNPEMPHRLYSRAEAAELIAEHFGRREVAAFRACAVPAMQSDYFRYCAVHALGGIYIDAGFGGVRSLSPLVENLDGGLLVGSKGVINGLFAFGARRHPLLRLAIDIATLNIEQRVLRKINLVAGPWVLIALTELARLGSFEAARESVRDPTLRIRGPRIWELELLLDACIEAVGEPDRIVEALADVRVVSVDRVGEFLSHKERGELEHKRHENDWYRWQVSGKPIFV